MKWLIWITRCSDSVSDIQDYIKYFIKNETIRTIPPIHVYFNRIDIGVYNKRWI